jgi:dopamine beta-monooxygenase
MCVNYVHYFPATDLEVCKSAISDQALNSYFNYMKQCVQFYCFTVLLNAINSRWENQNTSFRQGISDNYKAIRWNKMRVQLLTDVYKEAPLSMQCNMSSGDRFPGYWENTPVTPVLKPLPPPPRTC